MKTIEDKFKQMVEGVPKNISNEIDLSFDISNEIFKLMQKHHLTKKQFADAIGKKPSEVTKWLSGQHNFTIRTLAMLSAFFGEPLIYVGHHGYEVPDDNSPTMAAEDSTTSKIRKLS